MDGRAVMGSTAANAFHFDCFEADLATGELCRYGVRLRLRDQSFQVLAALIERAGEVVTREELRRRLWPDAVFVDFDNSLNTAVARLREALGDSADSPRFIETLPKRGYRFIAALHDGGEPAHAGGTPTTDVVAYNLYVQARHLLYRATPFDLELAKSYLLNALEHDAHFALAFDALAEVYWYSGFFGLTPPRDSCSAGIYYALRALELNSTLAETHALLAMYRNGLEYDWPEVHREMCLARDLDPRSPLVRTRYAMMELLVHGKTKEAIVELQAALESDPLSPFVRAWLVSLCVLDRNYDRANEEAAVLLNLDPDAYVSHWVAGFAFGMSGRAEEAITELRKAVELSCGSPLILGWLGLTLGLAGEREEAREILGWLHCAAREMYVPATSIAWTHLGLGEPDEAFAWMDRAVESGDQMMAPIRTYAFLDPLRGDPRFLDLLRRMHLD